MAFIAKVNQLKQFIFDLPFIFKDVIITFHVFALTRKYLQLAIKFEKINKGKAPPSIREGLIKTWASHILEELGIKLKIINQSDHKESMLFVGNHVSYLDIPLLLATQQIGFLTKKEVSKWPIFGFASAFIGCIFVDRSSKESRGQALDDIAKKILKEHYNVAIFPSGTTSLKEDIPWRHGVFKLAKDKSIKVQPFRITYDPLRTAAYIDDDTFVVHVFELLKQGKLKASIEFGKPTYINDVEEDIAKLNHWVRYGD